MGKQIEDHYKNKDHHYSLLSPWIYYCNQLKGYDLNLPFVKIWVYTCTVSDGVSGNCNGQCNTLENFFQR